VIIIKLIKGTRGRGQLIFGAPLGAKAPSKISGSRQIRQGSNGAGSSANSRSGWQSQFRKRLLVSKH